MERVDYSKVNVLPAGVVELLTRNGFHNLERPADVWTHGMIWRQKTTDAMVEFTKVSDGPHRGKFIAQVYVECTIPAVDADTLQEKLAMIGLIR